MLCRTDIHMIRACNVQLRRCLPRPGCVPVDFRRQRRECSHSASSYENRLKIAAKGCDFSGCSDVLKEMNEENVVPTARMYLCLLQMYCDCYNRGDNELCAESARLTFDKAHARGLTADAPALWSVMMIFYAKIEDARGARDLDRLRHNCGVPIPVGSMYCEALRGALRREPRDLGPPPGLANDREFMKEHVRAVDKKF